MGTQLRYLIYLPKWMNEVRWDWHCFTCGQAGMRFSLPLLWNPLLPVTLLCVIPGEEKFDSRQYWGTSLDCTKTQKDLYCQQQIYFTNIFSTKNTQKQLWPSGVYSKDYEPGLILKKPINVIHTLTDRKRKKNDPLNICRKKAFYTSQDQSWWKTFSNLGTCSWPGKEI